MPSPRRARLSRRPNLDQTLAEAVADAPGVAHPAHQPRRVGALHLGTSQPKRPCRCCGMCGCFSHDLFVMNRRRGTQMLHTMAPAPARRVASGNPRRYRWPWPGTSPAARNLAAVRQDVVLTPSGECLLAPGHRAPHRVARRTCRSDPLVSHWKHEAHGGLLRLGPAGSSGGAMPSSRAGARPRHRALDLSPQAAAAARPPPPCPNSNVAPTRMWSEFKCAPIQMWPNGCVPAALY